MDIYKTKNNKSIKVKFCYKDNNITMQKRLQDYINIRFDKGSCEK